MFVSGIKNKYDLFESVQSGPIKQEIILIIIIIQRLAISYIFWKPLMYEIYEL